MKKKNIIAFDLSLNSTGTAYRINGKEGTKNTDVSKNPTGKTYEMKMVNFLSNTLDCEEKDIDIVLVEDNRFSGNVGRTMHYNVVIAKFAVSMVVGICEDAGIDLYGITGPVLTRSLRESMDMIKETPTKRAEYSKILGVDKVKWNNTTHKKRLSILHAKEKIGLTGISHDEADAANQIWLFENGFKDKFKRIV